MPSLRPISVSKALIAFSTSVVVGLEPGSGKAPQMQAAFAGDAFAASAPRSWGTAIAPAPAAAEYFRKSRLLTLMRFCLLVLSHRARDRVTRTRSRAARGFGQKQRAS